MTKFVLFLIFSLLSLNSNAQTEINFKNELKIKHVFGDESYSSEEMKFEIRNGKVYGKINNPNTNDLINSETKLNKSKIKILNSFLKLVDEYKDNCDEEFTSSYIQNYIINKDKTEIKIYKFCDWKSLTYFDIKQKIFRKYLKNLEKEKQKLNKQIFITLKSKWFENTKIDKLETEAIYKLNRIENDFKSNEFIEFKKDNKMIMYRNTKNTYYKYEIDYLNGEKYLSIFGESEKNGEVFIYGHRFLIIELKENEIELKRS